MDGDREQDFVQAIHQVVGDGDSFSPREFAVPRFSIKVFEDTWRAFIDSLLGVGDGSFQSTPEANS